MLKAEDKSNRFQTVWTETVVSVFMACSDFVKDLMMAEQVILKPSWVSHDSLIVIITSVVPWKSNHAKKAISYL